MTRTHMDDEEREAMHILDLVAAGKDIPLAVINWALLRTGDGQGLIWKSTARYR